MNLPPQRKLALRESVQPFGNRLELLLVGENGELPDLADQ